MMKHKKFEKENYCLEDFAKSGYKSDMKYKSLVILLYGYTLNNENQV
jgi:hypothetical protein